MDDLTARLADPFRRYQTEFRRATHMSETELEQATERIREEIGALMAEYGHEAVVRTALLLIRRTESPSNPPSIHYPRWGSSYFSARGSPPELTT
jgi:hypothetical protein